MLRVLLRKLKNREAAQTARDRKKQRMSELEEALASVQAENAKLAAENEALRQSHGALTQENGRLRQCLDELPTSEGTSGNALRVKSEPAVLTTPLPQEQTRMAFQLASSCVTLFALLRCALLGCIVCTRCRPSLPMCAVSVTNELNDPAETCNSASLCRVILCSLCQITLASFCTACLSLFQNWQLFLCKQYTKVYNSSQVTSYLNAYS